MTGPPFSQFFPHSHHHPCSIPISPPPTRPHHPFFTTFPFNNLSSSHFTSPSLSLSYYAPLALAMGSCASVHRNNHLRLPFFLSKTHDCSLPSPLKDHPTPIHLKSFPNLACSGEESFFDSRPCFESDCEDDFFSVNGEFTPSSSGNTPRKWVGKRTGLENGSPRYELTTAVQKKKLIDLFEESSRRFNAAVVDEAFGTPSVSRVNSFMSHGGGRLTRAGPCCFPTLTSL